MLLPLLILVPLAGLIVLNLPFTAARRWVWGFCVCLALCQAALVVFAPTSMWTTVEPMNRLIAFTLSAPILSRVLLFAIGLVLFVTLIVERSLLTDDRQRSNFENVLLIALIGMNGAVLVSDLFSLYVFVEVTAIASFVLIAFTRGKSGLEGAFKYMVLSAVASVLMITAIAFLFLLGGGVSFAVIKAALLKTGGHPIALLAMTVFVAGLFIKSGLVPFHGWLPDAYSSAPAPASVMLAGIITKVAGVYALIRLTTTVFPASPALNQVLLLIGAMSIIIGALAAIGQTDLKRMLSYSSISQVGYIVLGLGCGTPLGIAGAIFHLLNHSVFKSLLFVNSAALEQRLGTTDMNRMTGLGSRMPVTATTSVIAALSTAGIPPLAGFWSKLIIVIALWQAHARGYAAIAVFFSLVTLAYLLRMQRKIFFGKITAEFANIREAGFGVVLSELVLAALTIVMGLLFPLVYNFIGG